MWCPHQRYPDQCTMHSVKCDGIKVVNWLVDTRGLNPVLFVTLDPSYDVYRYINDTYNVDWVRELKESEMYHVLLPTKSRSVPCIIGRLQKTDNYAGIVSMAKVAIMLGYDSICIGDFGLNLDEIIVMIKKLYLFMGTDLYALKTITYLPKYYEHRDYVLNWLEHQYTQRNESKGCTIL
jgi:hypothetical protein